MSSRKNPNCCLQRQINIYPHIKYHQLFIAYAHSSLLGKSRTGCEIIKGYFDEMTQLERDKLQSVYENMTPEQRKHPGRLDCIDE